MTTLDITPFLDAFADHPTEFWRFGMIADAFADVGDEVGEEWARWVMDKKRFPVNHDHEHPNDDNPQWTWGFWIESSPSVFLNASIPSSLGSALSLSREWYRGSDTIQLAYKFLLNGWRNIDLDSIIVCKNWNPSSPKPHADV